MDAFHQFKNAGQNDGNAADVYSRSRCAAELLDVIQPPKLDFPALARNTIMVAVLMVLGTTISSAIVAYGFAKIRFKGRGVLFGLMLATMMIPFPVTMVSLFTIFRWLGDNTPFQFLGTLKPLWLPAWFGSAFQHLFAAPVFRDHSR